MGFPLNTLLYLFWRVIVRGKIDSESNVARSKLMSVGQTSRGQMAAVKCRGPVGRILKLQGGPKEWSPNSLHITSSNIGWCKKKSFTVIISRKFAMQHSINIPPHLKRVAILPCEMLMSENSLLISEIHPIILLHFSFVKKTTHRDLKNDGTLYQSHFLLLPCDAVCTVSVIVILSVCPSVCLSVSLSHSWTVSTWFDLRSWFLHHRVAPSF